MASSADYYQSLLLQAPSFKMEPVGLSPPITQSKVPVSRFNVNGDIYKWCHSPISEGKRSILGKGLKRAFWLGQAVSCGPEGRWIDPDPNMARQADFDRLCIVGWLGDTGLPIHDAVQFGVDG